MNSRVFQRFLETFLAGFISRRSEYRGYWLFGFFPDATLDLEIDLLIAAPQTGGRPIDVAKRRSEQLFFQGLSAHRIHPEEVTSARLSMRAQGEPVDELVGGVRRRGRTVLFTIDSVYERTVFHAQCARFVAPHDPTLEQVSQLPFDEGEGRDT
jgi:hypothetical protein